MGDTRTEVEFNSRKIIELLSMREVFHNFLFYTWTPSRLPRLRQGPDCTTFYFEVSEHGRQGNGF